MRIAQDNFRQTAPGPRLIKFVDYFTGACESLNLDALVVAGLQRTGRVADAQQQRLAFNSSAHIE